MGPAGSHSGVVIFPDLSPRAKPYCGLKCSPGLHFPVPFLMERKTVVPQFRT